MEFSTSVSKLRREDNEGQGIEGRLHACAFSTCISAHHHVAFRQAGQVRRSIKPTTRMKQTAWLVSGRDERLVHGEGYTETPKAVLGRSGDVLISIEAWVEVELTLLLGHALPREAHTGSCSSNMKGKQQSETPRDFSA